MKTVILGSAVAAAGLAVFIATRSHETSTAPNIASDGSAALVEIVLPANLSQIAQIGKSAFDAKCAACHGMNAVGRNGSGPPLVHKIYEPSHHGDEAFQRAVAAGVRGHHWRFGDMAPVEGLTRADVEMIIEYIRELQRANGIN